MSPGGINYPHLKFHYHRLRHLIHLCTYHFCHRLFWNNIMFELLCLFLLINKILPATIFGNVSWPQSHASWFYATFDRGVDIVPVAFDSQNATTCRIGSIKTFNHDISRVEVLYVHTRNIYTKKQGDVPLWGDSIDMWTSAPTFWSMAHLKLYYTISVIYIIHELQQLYSCLGGHTEATDNKLNMLIP